MMIEQNSNRCWCATYPITAGAVFAGLLFVLFRVLPAQSTIGLPNFLRGKMATQIAVGTALFSASATASIGAAVGAGVGAGIAGHASVAAVATFGALSGVAVRAFGGLSLFIGGAILSRRLHRSRAKGPTTQRSSSHSAACSPVLSFM